VPRPSSTSRTRNEPVVDLAARLRWTVTRLNRRLRQEAGTGLTPSQLSTLATIDRHGPLPLGELAEREQVAPPSITKVATKLEAAGLIAREPGEEDRRVVRVSLTADGERLLEESRARKNAWLAERLARLDADQRARLAAALDVFEELTTGDGP
jgi:DNA-binding MarR family transcriptional regulator